MEIRTRAVIVVGVLALGGSTAAAVVASSDSSNTADAPVTQVSKAAKPAPGAATANAVPAWAAGGGPKAERGDGKGTAYWVRPASVKQLVDETDFIGAVTVVKVEPGKPLPSSGADDEQRDTQVVTLKVNEAWRARGKAPAEIQLFKTGTQALWIEEDPPYEVGQVYVLAAKQRAEDGLYIPYGPEGRLEVRDNRTRSFTDTPVAASFNGKSAAESARALGRPAR